MNASELLQRVISNAEIDDVLKKDIITFIFERDNRKSGMIPILARRSALRYSEIYRRMRTVAGGADTDVAKILKISSQGVNNQKRRGKVSAKSLLMFHVYTGVSLDWLVGAWNGCDRDAFDFIPENSGDLSTRVQDSGQKYLSLVEVYDQSTGEVELKYCKTNGNICTDRQGNVLPDDYAVLHSLIVRYKGEAGTPTKVKEGKKRYFLVRRVLAYVIGDPRTISEVDRRAKAGTADFISDRGDRPGKTEFRLEICHEECTDALKEVAREVGLEVHFPENATIAWDFLLGKNSMSPVEWVSAKKEEDAQALVFNQPEVS